MPYLKAKHAMWPIIGVCRDVLREGVRMVLYVCEGARLVTMLDPRGK